MNEDLVMSPTINERESSKSPSGSHSIDDILGIKATSELGNSHPHHHHHNNMYSGSDSSSDSSSNSGTSEREASSASPPPLALGDTSSTSTNRHHHQHLLQMATTGSAQIQQGMQQLAIIYNCSNEETLSAWNNYYLIINAYFCAEQTVNPVIQLAHLEGTKLYSISFLLQIY